MQGNIVLILPVLFLAAMGIAVLTGKKLRTSRRRLIGTAAVSLGGGAVLTMAALASGKAGLKLWQLTENTAIEFRVDQVSVIFAGLTAAMWLLVGVYSFKYMTHEKNEHQFLGWYLVTFGVLIGLDFAANLITFYIMYELMSLVSLPLVLHERTKEAVMAGLKYLFYSMAGAFTALFGIFFLTTVCPNLDFTPGGIFSEGMLSGGSFTESMLSKGILSGGSFTESILSEGISVGGLFSDGTNLILIAAFCILIGFGVKAGMFPFHGWLPTAHPAAPAPASAVLSGVIAKSGVLGIIRVVYFIIGPDMIRGTWVQNVWILLSLITVFMGSMLAYREPVLKKRLAYSTVSQISYILFGLSILQPIGFAGALSHVVFHSLIKNALFLAAGAIIFTTGWTRVEQMRGLGRIMPKMLTVYTIVSLGLIGIPPLSGFVSKWYLAQGALASGTGIWSWLGPVVLLVSALLTAGYLLPLTIQGFFPGADFNVEEIRLRNPDEKRNSNEKRNLNEKRSLNEEKNPDEKEPSALMLVPAALMAGATLLFGCFPGPLFKLLEELAAMIF
ncbi:MAG: proton-conducting transporter membrane subunit [Lachnospiraceae bacterium]|nr:proton-conducting transporter membrane subunit [Lachnospiraceae bacterium]